MNASDVCCKETHKALLQKRKYDKRDYMLRREASNQTIRLAYRFLDHVIALVIGTPVVVCCFRGLWSFEDLTIFPDNLANTTAVSFALGHTVIFLLTLGQGLLRPLVKISALAPILHFASPVYDFLWVSAFINHWRCIWYAYDIWIGETVGAAFRVVAVSAAVLGVTRTFAIACTCSPYLLLEDDKDNQFRCATRFKSEFRKSPWKFLADTALSVFVIQSASVFFWRAIWLLFTVVLESDSASLSAFRSLITGLVLTLLGYSLSPFIYRFDIKLSGLPKIIFQDAWLIYLTVSSISIWHGIWTTFDVYLAPEPFLSLFSFVLSLLILVMFFSMSMIFQRSILVDHDYAKGDLVRLNISYTVEMFKRNVKRQRIKNPALLLNKQPTQEKPKLTTVGWNNDTNNNTGPVTKV